MIRLLLSKTEDVWVVAQHILTVQDSQQVSLGFPPQALAPLGSCITMLGGYELRVADPPEVVRWLHAEATKPAFGQPGWCAEMDPGSELPWQKARREAFEAIDRKREDA